VEADRRTERAQPPTLLRSSRRLDWRFLLPDHRIGRVAYVGRRDPTLREALDRIADRVEAVDAVPAANELYDLVVCREPTPDELAAATALVRPGGCLYAEIERSLTDRLRDWRQPGHAQLDSLHPLSAEPFWHWPDFENCEEIVPLADPGAVQLMLARRRAYGAHAKVMAARALVALRLVGAAAPCISVVATAGASLERPMG
jgi:hypothetical protein